MLCVCANNMVFVFMYSLCGLDLGGLWSAVYVCRHSAVLGGGIELTEILPSFACPAIIPSMMPFLILLLVEIISFADS